MRRRPATYRPHPPARARVLGPAPLLAASQVLTSARPRAASWAPSAKRALAIVVLVTACGPTLVSPSVSPIRDGPTPAATMSPDAATTYRTIAGQVSVIRQLTAPDRVEPTVLDAATLRANLNAEFNSSNPPDEIAKSERILKVMGLLAPDVALARAYLDLQGSQVIGYYDPKVKKLFIVSRGGALGVVEQTTYAHEFTHELQDRRFDLQSLGLDTIKDDSDRALAILALVEGDATSAQTTWMTSNLTAAQLGEVVAQASDPAMLAVLARTPRILLETSLFPYQAGATFVGTLQAQGGYASVNAAYTRPPASTKQILHPDAYAAGRNPVPMVLPTDLAGQFGAGWTLRASDTFGELQTRVWLREGGVAGDVARIAAEGWAGDRLALLEGPTSAGAVVWSTAWDTAQDAAEFEAAAQTAIAGLHLDGLAIRSGARVAVGIRTAATPDAATLTTILRQLTLSGPIVN